MLNNRIEFRFHNHQQVQSPHNSKGYFTIYGDETDYNDHFSARLVSGVSTSETWARTGYLGFLRKTECSQACSLLEETLPTIVKDEPLDYDQTYPNSTAGTGTGTSKTTVSNPGSSKF